MASIYGVIGTKNPEYLLADPTGQDKIAVNLKPGGGVIARGTVIYKNGEMYEAAEAAQVVSTNYLAVLDEQVNTDEDAQVAEVAAAYRAGRLIAGKVIVKDGSAVTAAQALILRQQGIVLCQMDATAPEVTNTVG